jgi:hypothetical protein
LVAPNLAEPAIEHGMHLLADACTETGERGVQRLK